MLSRKLLAVSGAALAAILATGVHAQSVSPRPMIVVFNDDAQLDVYAPGFRVDPRQNAAPQAWQYLNRGTVGAVQWRESRHGFVAHHVYGTTLRGFAARLSARQIQELENDPDVAYVVEDGIATINAQTLPWGIDRIGADVSSTRAGNGSGTVGTVRVYVIDTGIDTGHRDLNVVQHVNFAGDFSNRDCHGHGTHVAGTAAAKDNTNEVVGVAPGARLIGVKVLGCNGSGLWSNVIKSIDWVPANAVKPAVANMSLGGGANQAVDDAVKKSAKSGVLYAIAAGNSGADACNSSPARAGTEDGVMTVAATDANNQETSWSNFGLCVDIWAPGANILSTRRGGGTATMSGTSMASPHVAGTAALYLSLAGNAGKTPAAVETALKSSALPTGTYSKLDTDEITLLNAATY
jgi:aqualysin 1